MTASLTYSQQIDFIVLLVFEAYWRLLLTPKKKFGLKLLEQNIRNVMERSREKQKDTTTDESCVINNASQLKTIKQAKGPSDTTPKKDDIIYNVIRAGILYHRMMGRIGAPQKKNFLFPRSVVKFFGEITDKWIDGKSQNAVTARKINEAFDDIEFQYEEKNEEEKFSKYMKRITKESKIEKNWLIKSLEYMTKGEEEPNGDIISFGSSKYRLNNNIKFSKTDFQRGTEIIAKWREWINLPEMEGQRDLHIRSVLSNISEFIDELKFSKKVIDTIGEITHPNNEITIRLKPRSLTFKKIFNIFIIQFWTPNIALSRIPGTSTIRHIIANKNHPHVLKDEPDFAEDILLFEKKIAITDSKNNSDIRKKASKIRNKLIRKKVQEWMDIEILRICTKCKRCSENIVIANNKQTGRYALPSECILSPSSIVKSVSMNSLVVGDKVKKKNMVGYIAIEENINLYEMIRKMLKRTK
jgi:hypothetical protein